MSGHSHPENGGNNDNAYVRSDAALTVHRRIFLSALLALLAGHQKSHDLVDQSRHEVEALRDFMRNHTYILSEDRGSKEQLVHMCRIFSLPLENAEDTDEQKIIHGFLDHSSIVVRFFAALYVGENTEQFPGCIDQSNALMSRLAVFDIHLLKGKDEKGLSQRSLDLAKQFRRSIRNHTLPSVQEMRDGYAPVLEEATVENLWRIYALKTLGRTATEENGGCDALRQLEKTCYAPYVAPLQHGIQERKEATTRMNTP